MVIDGSGDPCLPPLRVSSSWSTVVILTMAKTDSEADGSEHTSETEETGQVHSDSGDSKMTLEQRQLKLAQLRSRMVR